MTLPRQDMLSDDIPEALSEAIQKSHFFVVTKALSSAGVMHPDTIMELERIESMNEDDREVAFSEFMSNVEEKIESTDPEDNAEEVYL